jgi:hypothetical protein
VLAEALHSDRDDVLLSRVAAEDSNNMGPPMSKLFMRATQLKVPYLTRHTFTSTCRQRQQVSQTPPEKPVNFYRTHGRAFAKAITLAFLTYQITYWSWLTIEAEAEKDEKNREIKSLEQEVRLLDESRKGHKPGAG